MTVVKNISSFKLAEYDSWYMYYKVYPARMHKRIMAGIVYEYSDVVRLQKSF